MVHIQIIVLFVVLVLHDAVQSAIGHTETTRGALPGWAVWAGSLIPMAALALLTWLVVAVYARDVDRRGSVRAVLSADRVLGVSRWLAVVLHAVSVLVVGLLDQIRLVIGDVVAIDEFLAILPPLIVYAAGWWGYYPIERALRDRVMVRALDEGTPLFDMPTQWQFLILNLRHQVLLSLAPIAMIAVWSESAEWLLAWLAAHKTSEGWVGRIGGFIDRHGLVGPIYTLLQLAGVALVFTFSPLVLRRVWDTVRLSPGPLRSRLSAICESAGVGVRDLLVWRTYGTMINGAVIGLAAPLRYILLTDALLAHLSSRQVEAVMAHEVGHARHRHLPWLVLAMMLGIMGATVVVSLGAWLLMEVLVMAGRPGVKRILDGSIALQGGLTLAALGLGLMWFGFVSRRFEWQADAFAVKQLTRTPPVTEESGPTLWDAAKEGVAPTSTTMLEAAAAPSRVSPEAVAAMVGALGSVAELNHLPPDKPSWRHGSISHRQHRLRLIIGEPLESLSIDRKVRWLKRGVALGLCAMIGLAVWSQWWG